MLADLHICFGFAKALFGWPSSRTTSATLQLDIESVDVLYSGITRISEPANGYDHREIDHVSEQA
jgi:hypothetical protein